MVKPSESARACPLTSLSCNPGTMNGAKNTEHPMARSGQLYPGSFSCFLLLFSQQRLLPVIILIFSDLGDIELRRTRTGGSIMCKQPRIRTKSVLVQVPTRGFSL